MAEQIKINFAECSTNSLEIMQESDLNKLNHYMDAIDIINIDIDNQMEDYKVEYVKNGVSGDYKWLRDAKTKRKLYAKLRQIIQRRIGELGKIQRKKRKEERNATFTELFMAKVKEMDNGILFEDIRDEVLEEIEGK